MKFNARYERGDMDRRKKKAPDVRVKGERIEKTGISRGRDSAFRLRFFS